MVFFFSNFLIIGYGVNELAIFIGHGFISLLCSLLGNNLILTFQNYRYFSEFFSIKDMEYDSIILSYETVIYIYLYILNRVSHALMAKEG